MPKYVRVKEGDALAGLAGVVEDREWDRVQSRVQHDLPGPNSIVYVKFPGSNPHGLDWNEIWVKNLELITKEEYKTLRLLNA